jgi:hypothetical protein
LRSDIGEGVGEAEKDPDCCVGLIAREEGSRDVA